MAKHTRALAPRSNIIVMPAPRRAGRIRRGARAIGRGVRHVSRNRGGAKQLPVMGIGVGGLIAGWLTGKGYLDKLPEIGGSKTFTLGLAGYFAQRMSKNHYVREAGIAALAAAAFDVGKVQGGGTSGFEDGTQGDAGGGPHAGQGY